MFPPQTRRNHFAKYRIDRAIHHALAIARDRGSLNAFQQLLAQVLVRADWMRPTPVGGSAAWRRAERLIGGLLTLADHRKSWIRAVDDWKADGGNAAGTSVDEQFRSLAWHLFATQPVPKCLESVWFEPASPQAREHQQLYKRLARGHNIRSLRLPIQLTRSMAAHFPQAPADFTVEQAVRWCQVLGLGANERFAAVIAVTHLGTDFAHEAYWTRALQFLIEWHDLQLGMLAPVVEFLRCRPAALFPTSQDRATRIVRRSLLIQVRRQLARQGGYRPQPRLAWSRAPINRFEYVEPQRGAWPLHYWTIEELTNNRELLEDGRAMRHCVGTYAADCARHDSSIWSMRRHGPQDSRRVLTIEVSPVRRLIVQARGRFNARPGHMARFVMEKWDAANALTMSRSV